MRIVYVSADIFFVNHPTTPIILNCLKADRDGRFLSCTSMFVLNM